MSATQAAAAQQHGRDLDALDLAAGQVGAYAAVHVFAGFQTHFLQHICQLLFGEGLAGGHVQHVAHGDALKPHGLLESVAHACPGAFGGVKRHQIQTVQQDLPFVRFLDAGDHLGQRRFASPVGAGEADQLAVRDRQAYIVQDLPPLGGETEIFNFEHGFVFSFNLVHSYN